MYRFILLMESDDRSLSGKSFRSNNIEDLLDVPGVRDFMNGEMNAFALGAQSDGTHKIMTSTIDRVQKDYMLRSKTYNQAAFNSRHEIVERGALEDINDKRILYDVAPTSDGRYNITTLQLPHPQVVSLPDAGIFQSLPDPDSLTNIPKDVESGQIIQVDKTIKTVFDWNFPNHASDEQIYEQIYMNQLELDNYSPERQLWAKMKAKSFIQGLKAESDALLKQESLPPMKTPGKSKKPNKGANTKKIQQKKSKVPGYLVPTQSQINKVKLMKASKEQKLQININNQGFRKTQITYDDKQFIASAAHISVVSTVAEMNNFHKLMAAIEQKLKRNPLPDQNIPTSAKLSFREMNRRNSYSDFETKFRPNL